MSAASASATKRASLPAYQVTLRARPGVDPVRALRNGLKNLLRAHGLTCVAIKQLQESDTLIGSRISVALCSCGTNTAVIGHGKGPHAHAVHCEKCRRFRRWLSKAAAVRLHEAARVFRASRDAADLTKVPEISDMDTSGLFPQRYFKASKLTAPVVATIEALELHEMKDGKEKPVLVFANGQPPLVLNRSNIEVLQESMGYESGDWIGSRVELSPGTFIAQDSGETKAMVVLRVIEKPDAAAETTEAAKEVKRKSRGDMDDEIPF
jgi:hypothetical protein